MSDPRFPALEEHQRARNEDAAPIKAGALSQVGAYRDTTAAGWICADVSDPRCPAGPAGRTGGRLRRVARCLRGWTAWRPTTRCTGVLWGSPLSGVRLFTSASRTRDQSRRRPPGTATSRTIIAVGGRRRRLSHYASAEKAAAVYDSSARDIHGRSANPDPKGESDHA